jgi:hypothetical protein
VKKNLAENKIRVLKGNSNSLANQLSIHLILAIKKWPPIVWQTNLAKIETWQNSPPRAHIVVIIVVSL